MGYVLLMILLCIYTVDTEWEMDTTVQKWGNSLAIRIPKAFADEVGLDQSSEIDIQIIDGRIVIRPVKKPASLETLLRQVTEDNLHSIEMGHYPPM